MLTAAHLLPSGLSRSTSFLALASALLVAAAPAQAGDRKALSAAISPSFGPPTSRVSASGRGFNAGALVDVYFDTHNVCVFIASRSGAGMCRFNIPKDAQPQTHWVSLVQRNSGRGIQKPVSVRTDWNHFHGATAAHTGYNKFENTLNPVNAADLDLVWRAHIGPTTSSPVIWDNKVYIGGWDGKLSAFDSATGKPVPGFPKFLNAQILHSSPAVGDNIVYIATASDIFKLFAFNATTGAAIAGFPVDLTGPTYSSPTLYGGKIYISCADGKLHAFNAKSGAPVPGFPIDMLAGVTGQTVYASVSIVNGRIHIGTTDGAMRSYDAETGQPLSAFQTMLGQPIISTAVISAGQYFFTDAGGRLWGLRESDNSTLPGFPAGTESDFHASSPAIGGGHVIAATVNGHVQSYSAATSNGEWDLNLSGYGGSGTDSSPVIANGVAYVNSSNNFFAIDVATGSVLWRTPVETYQLASPAVANGMVFLGSSSGYLYAYAEDGVAPSERLPGGALGIRPALSRLKPSIGLAGPSGR